MKKINRWHIPLGILLSLLAHITLFTGAKWSSEHFGGFYLNQPEQYGEFSTKITFSEALKSEQQPVNFIHQQKLERQTVQPSTKPRYPRSKSEVYPVLVE